MTIRARVLGRRRCRERSIDPFRGFASSNFGTFAMMPPNSCLRNLPSESGCYIPYPGEAAVQPYVPKVGDRVYALGMNGAFVILSIDINRATADLKLLSSDSPKFFRHGVPIAALTLARISQTTA